MTKKAELALWPLLGHGSRHHFDGTLHYGSWKINPSEVKRAR